MSVADKLGKGSSFSAARPRSPRGRAKAIAQGDAPPYDLVRLRLTEVSPTPLNPRRNFGTPEELAQFGEELRQAQLAACVAVTRQQYLELWPDHDSRIGDAAYVLLNGERRYRAGLTAQLEALDFVVRDDLAATREDFIDQLLKENLDREDFDVIERARGVQQLVEVCARPNERGARARAAERLNRDRSWVTNQLVLLELPEELQAMLSRGELSERDGRMLARVLKDQPELTGADLLDHLKASKEQEAQERQREKEILRASRSSGTGSTAGLLSADNKRGGGPEEGASGRRQESKEQAPEPGEKGLLSADNKPAGASDGGAQGEDPYVLPWNDPEALHEILLRRMTEQHRQALAKLLLASTET